MAFHDDGKASLDHIYTAPDPRAYFTTLRKFDYAIPQLAKPHFGRLIDELAAGQPAEPVTVIDIGCSYGINAVLLRCDATMDELYERYGGIDASAQTRDSLLARDRELVRTRTRRPGLRVVGLDVSTPALAYAREATFVDDTVEADLERDEPTADQAQQLAGAGLVISTGCIGYVTERTIGRVVEAAGRPWMAHFVLRMYSFEPVAQCLAQAGYDTVRVNRMFKQRRFTSPEEQAQVLDTLDGVGVDPRGLEADGWLYAQLFISRPTIP
jgi:SAM-dependent methyltransferase